MLPLEYFYETNPVKALHTNMSFDWEENKKKKSFKFVSKFKTHQNRHSLLASFLKLFEKVKLFEMSVAVCVFHQEKIEQSKSGGKSSGMILSKFNSFSKLLFFCDFVSELF